MFSNNLLMAAASITAAGGYEVNYSCRFNDDDSAFLIKTSGAAGTPTTNTFFIYVKRGNMGTVQTLISNDNGSNQQTFSFEFIANNAMRVYIQTVESTGAAVVDWESTRVFRDPHAWYFLTFTLDTTPATPIFKVWNWNDEITEWTKSEPTPLATDDEFQTGTEGARYQIGCFENGSANFLDGYLAQVGYMDGVVITDPVTAGLIEVDDNGVYRPADVTGLDYGASGYLLDFANDSDLGNDISGNNNDLTSSGLADVDQMSDTPTNNWATLSSVSGVLGAGAVTLSNGNLDTVGTVTTSSNNTICSHTVTSGKWIWAVKPGSPGQAQNSDPWIFDLSSGENIYVNQPNLSVAGWGSSMDTTSTFVAYHGGVSNRSHTVSPVFAANDLQLMAVDIDNLKLWCGYYDNSAGTTNWMDGGTGITTDGPANGTDQTFTLTGTHFAFGTSTYGTRTAQIDFGQQTGIIDQITIPTGFKFLNTTNLAIPAIADPSADFQPNTRTGDATAGDVEQTGNSQFGTDLIVIKNRDQANEWMMVDRIRTATKELNWDSNNAETTDANGVTAFSATDGYTIGTGANGYNDNTEKFIDYHWRADGTTGSTNDAGSIQTTIAVNDTAGFSYGKYTGVGATTTSTIGHGLSAAPEFVISKRTNGSDWLVGFNADDAVKASELNNDTGSVTPGVTVLTSDSNTTMTITGGGMNDSVMIYFWAWHSVVGFSSFGQYEGNGATNGTVVLTNFKPAFIILKSIDSTSGWFIYDAFREGYNVANDYLLGNDPASEVTATDIDLLSNGFKLRIATDPNVAETYIYAAWAKNPFGGHGGTFGGGVAPATAR